MPWASFIILLAGGYVVLRLVSLSRNKRRLKYLGLTIAAVILLFIETAILLDGIISSSLLTNTTEFIIEWGHITSLAFVLSSLAIFIRESKPVFAQFPLLYTGLPLLIVISYILVKDTYAIKNWLLAIYQGGAITVALLMYSVYTYRRREYRAILSGIGVLLISYLMFWYIPSVRESHPWIWKLLFAAGIILTITGYEKAEQKALKRSQSVNLNSN